MRCGGSGCVEEGTLRNHMITESGRFRDSVYFSIIEKEWPDIKTRLKRNSTMQLMKETILLSAIAIVIAVNGACGSGPNLSNETAKANSNEPLAANSNQAPEANTNAIDTNSTISNVAGDQANNGKRGTNSNSSGQCRRCSFTRLMTILRSRPI